MNDKVRDIIGYTFSIAIILLLIFLAIFAGYGIYKAFFDKEEEIPTTSPVEEIVRVDSIIRENNNTKIIIEHLNTEKNEQVIKVRNLSNDSTLALFYELVKE